MIRKSPDPMKLIWNINDKVHLLSKLKHFKAPWAWYYNFFTKLTTDENYIVTKYK